MLRLFEASCKTVLKKDTTNVSRSLFTKSLRHQITIHRLAKVMGTILQCTLSFSQCLVIWTSVCTSLSHLYFSSELPNHILSAVFCGVTVGRMAGEEVRQQTVQPCKPRRGLWIIHGVMGGHWRVEQNTVTNILLMGHSGCQVWEQRPSAETVCNNVGQMCRVLGLESKGDVSGWISYL